MVGAAAEEKLVVSAEEALLLDCAAMAVWAEQLDATLGMPVMGPERALLLAAAVALAALIYANSALV